MDSGVEFNEWNYPVPITTHPQEYHSSTQQDSLNRYHHAKKLKQPTNRKMYVHAEEQVWVIFAINRDKAVFPLQCSNTSRQPILHVPEDTSPKIN